jgi:anti-sigma-K factor RskA
MKDMMNLTGAYAVNSLSKSEAEEFELYLKTSEAARNETTELLDTAVALGLATVPVEPSAGLRSSIMSQIATLEQLPALAVVEEPTKLTPAEMKAQSRWFRKPVIMATSMAAAAALIVGGVTVNSTLTDLQSHQVQESTLVALTQAKDSHKTSTALTTGGSATVVWSHDLDTAAVMVQDTPALPDDKAYALWFIDEDGQATAAGMLPKDSSTWSVLDGKLKAGDSVGVTVEPAGGSSQPTTAPILAVSTA